jgi:hypothetical protein
MKKIFVCSYFRPTARYSMRQNIEYAALCCKFVSKLGHAPFAPHLIYPWFLREDDVDQRNSAIAIGIEYMKSCDELWCFLRSSLDVKSDGMKIEISNAINFGLNVCDLILPDGIQSGTPIEVRQIYPKHSKMPWIVQELPDVFKCTSSK